MLHLIDGYNVTKRDPATNRLTIEEQREALERRMRTRARELIGTTDYLIVWDGAGGAGVVHRPDAKSAFTRMDTADDSIVARVRSATARLCVVTSDNGLTQRCRQAASHGVDIVPSEHVFEDALMFSALDDDDEVSKSRKQHSNTRRKDTAHHGNKSLDPNVGIPKGADAINAELKELWGIED